MRAAAAKQLLSEKGTGTGRAPKKEATVPKFDSKFHVHGHLGERQPPETLCGRRRQLSSMWPGHGPGGARERQGAPALKLVPRACSPVFFRNISFSCFQSTIVHRSRAAFSPISFHNRLRGLLSADWPNGWRLRCRCVVVSSHLVVVRFIPGDSIDVNQHFPDDRCIDRELRCRAAMAPTCHGVMKAHATRSASKEHVYNYPVP